MPRPDQQRPRAKQRLFSITEVIQMTGRSRSTINRWIDQGVLRAVRVPAGYRMIDATSVEALLQGAAPKPKKGRPRKPRQPPLS